MLIIGSMGEVGKQLTRIKQNGMTARDVDLIGTFDELNEYTKRLKSAGMKVISKPHSKNKTVLFTSWPAQDTALLPIEVEIAWPGSTAEELLHAAEELNWPKVDYGFEPSKGHYAPGGMREVPLDVLYTLKLSHRYLRNSPHFHKTMGDILEFRSWGAKIWSEEWLKRREKETYWYNHPNLNTSKKDFFKMDEGVNYIFDHDDIHQAVARVEWNGVPTPAYKLYAAEGEVLSSKKKFFELDRRTRLYGVFEEATVLALERSQIPFGSCPYEFVRTRMRLGIDPPKIVPRPHESFVKALEKVCTSITSGWFREFAWENYPDVRNMYDVGYVQKFWAAVQAGKVRRTPTSLEKEKIIP